MANKPAAAGARIARSLGKGIRCLFCPAVAGSGAVKWSFYAVVPAVSPNASVGL